MTRCIFITGTDTDSGKTHISTLLIRALNGEGLLTCGFKPIASGAQPWNPSKDGALSGVQSGDLVNDDAQCLLRASAGEVPYALVNPYCFAPPIAPHVAALQAGIRIGVDDLTHHLNQLTDYLQRNVINTSDQAPVVVVEGAGGWAVPLNESQTLSSLAVQAKMPIVMVVAMKLGCINHAMLTAQAIQSQGGRLVGWIANQTTPDPMTNHAESLAYLRQQLPAPLIAEVPFVQPAAQHQDDTSALNVWQFDHQTLQYLLTATDCS